MPSPNNPPASEFFNAAQNASFQDSILSNTSGHVISVRVVNHFPPGNLAQLSPDNQDLQPPFGQMTEESPFVHSHPAPGKSNNPFAVNGNDPEVETTGTSHLTYFAQANDFDIDPPFTNSSNESYFDPSSFWGDGPLQHQVSVSSCPYPIPLYANVMARSFPTLWARDPGAPQIAASSAL